MSLLTDTPQPYDFLDSFDRACQRTGLDYRVAFDSYFTAGYMFKGPNYLMLGAEDRSRPDAWVIMWAEMHPAPKTPLAAVALFLKLMPAYKPYVGWARYLKNRREIEYYSTDRLLKLTAKLR